MLHKITLLRRHSGSTYIAIIRVVVVVESTSASDRADHAFNQSAAVLSAYLYLLAFIAALKKSSDFSQLSRQAPNKI